MRIKPTISLIINTYNWPEALRLQLQSINQCSDLPDEVIVTDDGSTEQTARMLIKLKPQLSYPLTHLWQQDEGFRVAQARNHAIEKASGEYIIFLDHDYIVRKHFIRNHRRLAEKGFFVSGSRILLSPNYTDQVIKQQLTLSDKRFLWFLNQRLKKHCNRSLTTLPLPLSLPLRKMRHSSWKSTRNLIAVWREDLIAINGYDHSFEGWGYEDSDLVIRLLHHGVKRKLGKFATEVMHLHHPIASREKESVNYQKLMDTLNKKRPIKTQQGIYSTKPDYFSDEALYTDDTLTSL